MALYAIGDLHLSLGTDKPMDVFGGRWEGYIDKIIAGFSVMGPEDTCVICGDLSWASGLSESRKDFLFVDSLPGDKIVLKGNHDFWWNTVSKITRLFEKEGITGIRILHNNCYGYGDTAICGTRGWFYEEESDSDFDRRILNRELMRLEVSLKAAGSCDKLCFLHYPPVYKQYVCPEIIDMMHKYQVKKCFYGHIHGIGHKYAQEGLVEGIEFRLVSADHLNFRPLKVAD